MSRSEEPAESLEQLFAAHYPELRRLAHSRLMAGGRNTVLDTTALVHESFVRLCGPKATAFPNPAGFFVYAGKVMRSVIVDLVRRRESERRGGDIGLVTLTTQIEDPSNRGEAQILQVDEALTRLAELDPRMAQVVELRYFAGMTEPEIAKVLGVTDRTVRRDWQQARLLLAEALR